MQQGCQGMQAHLLERRSGPLTADIRARFQDASQSELAHWADNILTASSLDDVFRGR